MKTRRTRRNRKTTLQVERSRAFLCWIRNCRYRRTEGGLHSGISVEDPNKKGSDGPNDIVKNILKKAQE